MPATRTRAVRARPGSPELDALLATLRDARFGRGLHCPRCGSSDVQRWGSFKSRQRYRCGGCRRTFSDLTATPAAYAKKLLLWVPYSRCLAESLSVRRSARRVGIHPCTAFRWRHALLTGLRQSDRERLAGWLELDTLWFAYSEKGHRPQHRRPRRRGLRLHPLLHPERVHVLVACDRLGHVLSAVTRAAATARPSSGELEQRIGPHLDGVPTIIAAHGRFGPASLFARRRHGTFYDSRPIAHPPPGPLSHLGTARVRSAPARLAASLPRRRHPLPAQLPDLAPYGRPRLATPHRRRRPPLGVVKGPCSRQFRRHRTGFQGLPLPRRASYSVALR